MFSTRKSDETTEAGHLVINVLFLGIKTGATLYSFAIATTFLEKPQKKSSTLTFTTQPEVTP